MSNDPTATAGPTEEDTSYPDQDWGKISVCIILAITAAIAIHYVAFEIVFSGVDLPPTAHALIGMVLFFIAGFASFSIFY